MASPFTIFRKNQKILLVVLAVMCMLAFVVASPLMQMMESHNRGGEKVAVTTKYGPIREIELQNMRRSREVTNVFVTDLMRLAGLDPRLLPGGHFFGSETEEAVVFTMLLTQRAKEMGVVVSDNAVESFIRQITQDKVSSDDIRRVISRLGVRQRALFDALQTELAAQRVQRLLSDGIEVNTATPGERFDYFRRLQARVRAEVVAVPVADFVDDVPPPGEDVLHSFYEKYKDDLPNSNSPDPGFRQPKRVDIQFVTAEYASFVDAKAVSDEEVQKYYQEHLEDYKSLDALLGDEDAKKKADVDPADANVPLLERAEALTLNRDITAGPNPKYKPLWDVEASIRDKLAAESANGRMEAALEVVETAMVAYEKKRKTWEIDRTDNESLPAPQPIDLEAIATENGFKFTETGLISAADLSENYPGLANATVKRRSTPFWYVAFRDLLTYTAVSSTDTDGNRYLAWVTKIAEERVPEFAEIKDEVESAWRFDEARKLARGRADELATEARDSGQSLATTFTGREDVKVITTGSFSWLTPGSVPQYSTPRFFISEVEGVDRPGTEFMKTAFSLSAGETGVAMNVPESVAYVIRITNEDTPVDLLEEQFITADPNLYLRVGQSDAQQIFTTWQNNLLADAKVDWKRPPYRETRR